MRDPRWTVAGHERQCGQPRSARYYGSDDAGHGKHGTDEVQGAGGRFGVLLEVVRPEVPIAFDGAIGPVRHQGAPRTPGLGRGLGAIAPLPSGGGETVGGSLWGPRPRSVAKSWVT